MLEEAIPALWSTVHGWFTPAVLFLVLNLVIGTIAVTSKVTGASGRTEGDGGEKRLLSRVPSMALDRIRSFNLSSRLSAPAPEPPVTGFLDLGGSDQQRMPLQQQEEGQGEIVHEHEQAHMERSMSEAAVEEPLPRLPTRLRKSASEKSAFAHFVVEEDAEVVEVRRPATTRDVVHRQPLVVEAEDSDSDSEDETEESSGSGEVDARADDFINKFRHQLKLQRIDSFMRYKDTLRRGQPAAMAGTE